MKDNEDVLMQAAGVMSMLRLGGKRVSAYNDLLEDEWQGRQSALEFLYKGGDILSVMTACGADCARALQAGIEKEPLPLEPVLEGVAGSRKWEHAVSVESKSTAFVGANVHLLQKYLSEMVSEMALAGDVLMKSCDVEINADELSMLRSELPAGNYAVICLERAGVPFELNDYRQSADYCFTDAEIGAGILRWAGMAAVHGGELCIHTGGIAGGAMLIFPVVESGDMGGIVARDVNGRKETILLVDDEDMIWDVVQGMLCELGYNVLLAADGQEAVDIYKANIGEIDLVLMDMMMPVMNAREAYPQLKEADGNVKVLLMSGYVDEADVQDLLAAGAMGFVRKPYTLADLAQRIRDVLDKGRID